MALSDEALQLKHPYVLPFIEVRFHQGAQRNVQLGSRVEGAEDWREKS
jgi:hypothetical protein